MWKNILMHIHNYGNVYVAQWRVHEYSRGRAIFRAFQAFFMFQEVGWLALKMHENMSFLAKILVLCRKFLSINFVLAFQKLGGGQGLDTSL